MRIILVRHGYSEANEKEFWGGQVDVDLTEKGLHQAQIVADYIAKNYKIDAVYSSTLKRAIKTADRIAEKFSLPIKTDKRLCEFYGGKWEGMHFSDIEKDYPQQFALWGSDLSKVQPPDGENALMVQQRGLKALQDIARENENKTVVVVSHRVIIRCLQCLWENRSIDEINKCQWLSNCSISEIEVKGGRLIPINIGQDDFMGEEKTKVNTNI